MRNYLLSRLPPESSAASTAQWNAAIEAVTSVGDTQTPVAFVRHYWSGREGATRDRDLYRSIRSRISNADAAAGFLDEISEAARAYAALLDPSHEAWTEYSAEAAGLASVLSHLELARVRPLVLALMLADPAQQGDMFDALSRWLPRGLLSKTIGGSVAERAFATAAQRVRAGTLENVPQLRTALSALIPTDQQFNQAFGNYRLRRPQVGSYVLAALRDSTASPFGDRPSSISDWTVVPVLSPGLVQQFSSGATPEAQRQLDRLRESVANFVLVEAKSAQALKGTTGENRITAIGRLSGEVMPSELTADGTLTWLGDRLATISGAALDIWYVG